MKPHNGWKGGDVVQVVDEDHDWYGVLAIVIQAINKGVLVAITWPAKDGPAPPSFRHLKEDIVQRICEGSAYVVPVTPQWVLNKKA